MWVEVRGVIYILCNWISIFKEQYLYDHYDARISSAASEGATLQLIFRQIIENKAAFENPITKFVNFTAYFPTPPKTGLPSHNIKPTQTPSVILLP